MVGLVAQRIGRRALPYDEGVLTFYINDLSAWLCPGDVMFLLDAGRIVVATEAELILYQINDNDVEEIERAARASTPRLDLVRTGARMWADRVVALRLAPELLRQRIKLTGEETLAGARWRASLVNGQGRMTLAGVWYDTATEAVQNLLNVVDLEEISNKIAEEMEKNGL